MLAAMVNGDCASLQGIASCQVRHWRRVVAAVHFLSRAGRPAALLRASSPGPHCAVDDPLQRLRRVGRRVRQPRRNSAGGCVAGCVHALHRRRRLVVLELRRMHSVRVVPGTAAPARPAACRSRLVPCTTKAGVVAWHQVRAAEGYATASLSRLVGSAPLFVTWSIHAAGDCDARASVAPASLGGEAGTYVGPPVCVAHLSIRPADGPAPCIYIIHPADWPALCGVRGGSRIEGIGSTHRCAPTLRGAPSHAALHDRCVRLSDMRGTRRRPRASTRMCNAPPGPLLVPPLGARAHTLAQPTARPLSRR